MAWSSRQTAAQRVQCKTGSSNDPMDQRPRASLGRGCLHLVLVLLLHRVTLCGFRERRRRTRCVAPSSLFGCLLGLLLFALAL